jgi:hypothetical protein
LLFSGRLGSRSYQGFVLEGVNGRRCPENGWLGI